MPYFSVNITEVIEIQKQDLWFPAQGFNTLAKTDHTSGAGTLFLDGHGLHESEQNPDTSVTIVWNLVLHFSLHTTLVLS